MGGVVGVGAQRELLDPEGGRHAADRLRGEQLIGLEREIDAVLSRRIDVSEPAEAELPVTGAMKRTELELRLAAVAQGERNGEVRFVVPGGLVLRTEVPLERGPSAAENERSVLLPFVEMLATIRLITRGLRVAHLPLERRAEERHYETLSAEARGEDPALDVLEPGLTDVVHAVVDVLAFPAMELVVGAPVVHPPEVDAVVVVEPVVDRSDSAPEHRGRGAYVVVEGHVGERFVAVVVLFLLDRLEAPRVGERSEEPERLVPELDFVPVARREAPGQDRRPVLHLPVLAERLSELLDRGVAVRVREVFALGLAGEEPALRDDLVVGGDDVGHFTRAVVETEEVPVSAVVVEEVLSGRVRVHSAADGEAPDLRTGEVTRRNVDDTAAEVARLVRSVGLLHDDVVEQSGREHVHRHDALVRLGRANRCAVDGRRTVALSESAHVDVLAVDDGEAGHALESICRVRVRGLRDLRRADSILDRRRLLLELEDVGLAVLDLLRGHLHLFDDVLHGRGREREVEREVLPIGDLDLRDGERVVPDVARHHLVGPGCRVEAIRPVFHRERTAGR